jgi:hypothetical protein
MSQDSESFTLSIQILVTIIATVLSFVSGWALHQVNDHFNRRRVRKESLLTLVAELKRIGKDLQEHPKPSVNHVGPTSADYEMNFRLLQMPTGAFDVILRSGVYSQLDSEIQLMITETYGAIKLVNRLYFFCMEVTTSRENADMLFIKNMEKQFEVLSSQIDDLKNKVAVILPKLEEFS